MRKTDFLETFGCSSNVTSPFAFSICYLIYRNSTVPIWPRKEQHKISDSNYILRLVFFQIQENSMGDKIVLVAEFAAWGQAYEKLGCTNCRQILQSRAAGYFSTVDTEESLMPFIYMYKANHMRTTGIMLKIGEVNTLSFY